MITREDILNLAEKEQDICISIYLPTHKMGEEVQQDPIRLKNLLTEAKEQLKEHKVKEQRIKNVLKEPTDLLDKPMFWQHNDKGLALFITEDDFEYHRVPHSFKERVMVDDHFLITPLVPMISLEGSFCILALSQKKVRLLRCSRAEVTEIELEDSPKNMEEFKKYDVYEKNITSAGSGGSESMFHGWGDGSVETDYVENYLKTIENEVTSILRKRNDPLVLTGINEAVALYRKANHYSRIMDETISGNPDPKSNEEIKDEGWEIIQSYFLKDMYDDIKRFGDLSGSDKQSDNLTKIVEAAYYGKVESLFVPIGEHSWGWFDTERDVVHHSPKPKNGEHDLINMAAIKTLTQSGNVYALDKEDMPNDSSIAAIFRYA
ncbi:hypothetical protein [Fodinibius saliphilus]|uniref:baeRF7 domain-containing protein n=1 Tax=Fodinibius saliphilus TaxID=1920650 RepID=UPI0011099AC4|nr:hypothetical protein [Fodinibius saliphilus]